MRYSICDVKKTVALTCEKICQLQTDIVHFLLPEQVFLAYTEKVRAAVDCGNGGQEEVGSESLETKEGDPDRISKSEQRKGVGSHSGGEGGSGDGVRMSLKGFVRLLEGCGVVPEQLSVVCVLQCVAVCCSVLQCVAVWYVGVCVVC